MVPVNAGLHFALTLGALHTATFAIVWGLFSWMFAHDIAKRFQVAGGKHADDELAAKARRELIGGHLLFVLLVYAVVYPLWTWRGGSMQAAMEPPLVVVAKIAAFILIQDTIFYWSHRTLHRPYRYRRIHARHHRFRYVRTPVAEFAHPVENALNFIAFFAGPLTVGCSFPTLMLWVGLRMVETCEAHSGYALTGVSSRHSFHHLYAAKGCYGSYISPWDRLLGTDRQWRAWRREQTH